MILLPEKCCSGKSLVHFSTWFSGSTRKCVYFFINLKQHFQFSLPGLLRKYSERAAGWASVKQPQSGCPIWSPKWKAKEKMSSVQWCHNSYHRLMLKLQVVLPVYKKHCPHNSHLSTLCSPQSPALRHSVPHAFVSNTSSEVKYFSQQILSIPQAYKLALKGTPGNILLMCNTALWKFISILIPLLLGELTWSL